MQLIKRKPHLGWIINLLAILLICFLMLNSILGSIYVNQLKKKILGLTDHYFLAQKEILEAKKSLYQSKYNILNFILLNRYQLTVKEIEQINSKFLQDIAKDFIAINSHLKEINKFNIDQFMTDNSKKILPIVNNYTLNLQKELEIYLEEKNNDYNKLYIILQKKDGQFNEIIFTLEILARLIQDKTVNIRITDDLLLKYLPSVFLFTFFAALLTGGGFIYVSRREVRKSIIENTIQVLTEAREYQLDCIETLQTCKELSGKGSEQVNQIYASLDHSKDKENLLEIINNFKEYTAKIEFAFEIRRYLHEKEKAKIEQEILAVKNDSKNIF